MGYNGNNRGRSRRRNEHRGAYKSGGKIMGSLFMGLIGLGALAVNEAAKSVQNSPQSNTDKVTTSCSLGCLTLSLVFGIPLAIFGFKIPLIGVFVIFIASVMIFFSVEECAQKIKALPKWGKFTLWLLIVVFSLYCSCWIFKVDIIPILTHDTEQHIYWILPNVNKIMIALIGTIMPILSSVSGYLVGTYKIKKKKKAEKQK